MEENFKESLGSRHPALTILRRLSAQVDRHTDIWIDSEMDREIDRQMDIHIKSRWAPDTRLSQYYADFQHR